jgi:hypothetical protein
MEAAGGENERRKHRRLLVRTGTLCRKIGSLNGNSFSGNSLNISPDGLLVEGSLNGVAAIDAGDLFNIEMDIPVADRADQIGGKVSAYAKVVRIIDDNQKSSKRQIAFQFCSRPQFDI